ncbi:MAG: zinc-binding alcohol dehydrogenase [Ectothiorhodospiraceae bacterium]
MNHPDSARQFRVTAPGHGEIATVPLAEPGPGELLVRTRYSAVSRGTESLVFHGRVPPSQYQAMQAPFQQGAFPAPVAYGYINVGEVIGGEPEWHGRTVFCLYPHQDYYVVPVEAVQVVPEGVPAGRAVLAAGMETALNGVWDGGAAPGDRIVVIGGGVIGLLVAWLCRQLPGASVTLVDPLPERADTTATLGIAWAAEPPETRADRVFHASATPEGLGDALACAGMEATVVEMSWYGDRPVPAPLGEAFHSRRLRLRSSQVGALEPERRARWDPGRRLQLALSLLTDPALETLLSGESAFTELPRVMADLTATGASTLCHRIRYPD